MSDPAYLDALIAELQPEIDERLTILHSEYPEQTFSWTPLHSLRENVEIAIAPERAVHAFEMERSDRWIDVDVANLQPLPVRLVGGVCGTDAPLTLSESRLLPGRPEGASLRFETVRLSLAAGSVWPADAATPVELRYELVGSARERVVPAFPWPHAPPEWDGSDLPRPGQGVGGHEFLVVDEQRREIAVKPGTWRVDRDVVLPPGYRVVARGGTTLDLASGASIVSYSPVDFVGDEDDPIRIVSTDATGEGLVVLQPDGESVLQHVEMNGLSNPQSGSWVLTGAATFYEAPVRMQDCRLLGARSEDALNIVRAAFELDRVQIVECASDALDVDFGTGTIRDCEFVAIGNDAIDVSGTDVEIERVVVAGARDKGISVGEDSALRGRGVSVRDAFIGLAAKDLSTVKLSDVRVLGGSVGITAYQKKSEFGPAQITIDGAVLDGAATPLLVERGSAVTIDGETTNGEAKNVYDTLYPPSPDGAE